MATEITNTTNDQSPIVAVWRSSWLQGSETFIRSQMVSLSRWVPVAIGVKKLESSTSASSDRIVFSAGRLETFHRRFFKIVGHHPRMRAAIVQSKATIIHAHFADDAAFVMPIARALNLPLVVTVHGYDIGVIAHRPGIAGRIQRRRIQSVFEYATRVIAVSEAIAEHLLAFGVPEEKVVVHHIGIAIDGTTHTDDRSKDLLFVGRLVEKKGLEDLFNALARSSLAHKAVTIVGDGPLRTHLETRAKSLGLEAAFLGHQSAPAVRDLMRSHRILVAPSQTAPNGDVEGLPIVLLEAAASGMAVVAYDHSGIREAIDAGSSGILVPEGDVSGLQKAVELLVENHALTNDLGQQGISWVHSRFDIADRTPLLEAIYDSAILTYADRKHS